MFRSLTILVLAGFCSLAPNANASPTVAGVIHPQSMPWVRSSIGSITTDGESICDAWVWIPNHVITARHCFDSTDWAKYLFQNSHAQYRIAGEFTEHDLPRELIVLKLVQRSDFTKLPPLKAVEPGDHNPNLPLDIVHVGKSVRGRPQATVQRIDPSEALVQELEVDPARATIKTSTH